MRVSTSEARKIGNRLDINWKKVNVKEFRRGLEVEWEHKKVLGGDIKKVAEVALAHLKEYPDYYTRLKIVESKRRLK